MMNETTFCLTSARLTVFLHYLTFKMEGSGSYIGRL